MKQFFIIFGLFFILWSPVAVLVLFYIFAEGVFWIIVYIGGMFVFSIFPLWWCWKHGGPPWRSAPAWVPDFPTPPWRSDYNVFEYLFFGGVYMIFATLFFFPLVGFVPPHFSGISEPLLCPFCNKKLGVAIMWGLYLVYGLGGVLLTWGVHGLFIGNLSTLRRRQLALFLHIALIPLFLFYFLPGWIPRLTGPLFR